MKNWQCFGRFLGRGWRGDGSEQKAKKEGFVLLVFFIVPPVNTCTQFHLIMFFFIVLHWTFSLLDYGDPKCTWWSSVTVQVTHYPSSLRPDVNETFCSTEHIPTCICSLFLSLSYMQMLNEGPWLPDAGGCILATAKAASCPFTAEVLIPCSKHSRHHWDDGQEKL